MKPKVLITYRVPMEGLINLKEHFDLIYPEEMEFSEKELVKHAKEAVAILSVFIRPVSKAVIDSAPMLKIIANFGVGYNNIDVQEASRRGIVVCNTPNAVTEPTAEMAMGLLLDVVRRISETDRGLRSDPNFKWGMMENLGAGLYGKSIGIIGMGRIGRALARRAVAFGMKVIYYNRNRLSAELERLVGAQYVDLKTLLSESDVVSLNCPLTPETTHLINEDALKQMKQGAYIVNTARGPVIDEKALVKYLKNGKIAGAGLDVFEREPIIEPELLELNQVVLTPHNATGTVDTRIETALEASENILRFFNGEKEIAIVNPEVW